MLMYEWSIKGLDFVRCYSLCYLCGLIRYTVICMNIFRGLLRFGLKLLFGFAFKQSPLFQKVYKLFQICYFRTLWAIFHLAFFMRNIFGKKWANELGRKQIAIRKKHFVFNSRVWNCRVVFIDKNHHFVKNIPKLCLATNAISLRKN